MLGKVLTVVCQQNGVSKSRRLGYLNAAVRAIAEILALGPNKQSPLADDEGNKRLEERVAERKVPAPSSSSPPSSSLSSRAVLDFGEEDFTREQYFCL